MPGGRSTRRHSAAASRQLSTEFAGFPHKKARLGPLSEPMMRGNERGWDNRNKRGTNMTKSDGLYFAELSDNDDDEPVPYDNQVIEASNDEEAIGKAGAWAASRKLGVVAMLIVKQGLRGVHSRKIYLGA